MVSALWEKVAAALPDGQMAIAYSGGLDSRFLCHAAQRAGKDILAIHAAGPHIPDTPFARDWAMRHGLRFWEMPFNPLDMPQIATWKRCYVCKKTLFENMRLLLKNRGENGRILCDGGNADDHKAYRPGIAATREAGVLSPLAALDKSQIRELGYAIGLDFVEQTPRPCLLTRLDYGIKPEIETLTRIKDAEAGISSFLENQKRGKCDFRLRLLPEPVLHINPGAGDLIPDLEKILAKFNFSSCEVVEMTNLSGFFDRQAKLIA